MRNKPWHNTSTAYANNQTIKSQLIFLYYDTYLSFHAYNEQNATINGLRTDNHRRTYEDTDESLTACKHHDVEIHSELSGVDMVSDHSVPRHYLVANSQIRPYRRG
jgi:hypothetical protein